MRIVAVSLSLILLGAFLAIGYVLLVDVDPRRANGSRDLEILLSTVPDPRTRDRISSDVAVRAEILEAAHGSWLGRKRDTLRPLWGHAVLRSTAAATFLPAALAMTGTAVVLGLSRRERAKLTFAYCSTTWSYIGKHSLALAIGGYVFTAFCPLGLPIWMLYVFAGFGACGSGLYFAHLPPKI